MIDTGAKWKQEFHLFISTSTQGLTVELQSELCGRSHEVISTSLETLLDNFFGSMREDSCGCNTEFMQSASLELRRLADRIDSALLLSKAESRGGCCEFCDYSVSSA